MINLIKKKQNNKVFVDKYSSFVTKIYIFGMMYISEAENENAKAFHDKMRNHKDTDNFLG